MKAGICEKDFLLTHSSVDAGFTDTVPDMAFELG